MRKIFIIFHVPYFKVRGWKVWQLNVLLSWIFNSSWNKLCCSDQLTSWEALLMVGSGIRISRGIGNWRVAKSEKMNTENVDIICHFFFLISSGSTRIWKLTKPEKLHCFCRAWDSLEKASFLGKDFFQKLFKIPSIHCPQRHYSKQVDIKMTYSDNFSGEWTNFSFGHTKILKTN